MYRIIPCLQGHKSFWVVQPALLYFGQEPQLAQRSGHGSLLIG